MKLNILCKAAGLTCPKGHEEDEVRSIVTNSSEAVEGSLFICIRGIHADGHRWIPEAVRRGAKWIVAEHDTLIGCHRDVVYLFTESPRRAAAYLYDAWYGHPARGMHLIGVTGTNGKTTVTQMIRQILSACGHGCVAIGTLGCTLNGREIAVCKDVGRSCMTTPDPEFLYAALSTAKRMGAEYAVMEVSSHALALQKVAPLGFEVAVFTNLTPEHLDFHRDMDGYANAKAALFSQCEHAIVNIDSPYADRMIERATSYTRCSAVSESDAYASGIELAAGLGVSYRLCAAGESCAVRCPIPAGFSVMNSMQALLAVDRLGIPMPIACKALADMEGVRGRMERLPVPEALGFSAVVDYAHTPDALQNLLQSARAYQATGRTVLLFGCGGDRDRTKRPVMGQIASFLADAVILTSDNSRSEDPREILLEILEGLEFEIPCTVIADRAKAIRYAVMTAERGDLLILAGKGHEEYEIDARGKRPFSEREILLSACNERLLQTNDRETK